MFILYIAILFTRQIERHWPVLICQYDSVVIRQYRTHQTIIFLLCKNLQRYYEWFVKIHNFKNVQVTDKNFQTTFNMQ